MAEVDTKKAILCWYRKQITKIFTEQPMISVLAEEEN